MAKPRTIKFEEGTITLSGYSKEKADAISAYIEAYNKAESISCDTIKKENNISVKNDLHDKSIGVRMNSVTKEYEVVTIKYNIESNEASIDEVQKVGKFKNGAVNAFKSLCFEHKFV